MLETIRRYWIGMLVMVLVTLHAGIVGIIRYQASMAKTDVSCEVDLGRFLAYRPKEEQPIEMHLYAIVPLNHRMKSRQLIELNQAQVRQAVEEHLRQLDGRLLIDPYLADLRSQLHEILSQTLGASSVEDVVVTNVEQSSAKANLSFLANANRPEPRKLVATLRGKNANEEEESSVAGEESESHGDADSNHEEHESSADEPESKHAEPPKKPAADAGHAKKPSSTSSHGKKPASESAHGKKPAADSSHGKKPTKH